jgi:hypothetical protein
MVTHFGPNETDAFCAWSKSSVLECLDFVLVKIVSFSMAGMCHGQNLQNSSISVLCHDKNRQFQQVWT